MRKQAFEALVREAVGSIPDEFLGIMKNVDIQLRRWPTKDQVRDADLDEDETLLGLYVGIPVTERDSGYNMVQPDIITLFQGPIEESCTTDAEVQAQVRDTVIHEVAHYFGISDSELFDWGLA